MSSKYFRYNSLTLTTLTLSREKSIIFLYGIPHNLQSTMKLTNHSSNATLFEIDLTWSKIQPPHYIVLKKSPNHFSENVSLLLVRNKPDQNIKKSVNNLLKQQILLFSPFRTVWSISCYISFLLHETIYYLETYTSATSFHSKLQVQPFFIHIPSTTVY